MNSALAYFTLDLPVFLENIPVSKCQSTTVCSQFNFTNVIVSQFMNELGANEMDFRPLGS